MIAKEGNELHEPGGRKAYNCIELIKNKEVEGFIFKVENAVSNKGKSNQGANKKNKNNNQFNRQQGNTGQLFFDRLL